MGAWADITRNDIAGKVKGLAEEMLSDRETRSFDGSTLDGDRVGSAKDLTRRKLLNSDLKGEVDRYDSPELFLDDLAGSSKIEDLLDEAIAHAFLHVYTGGNQVGPNGRFGERKSDFLVGVEESVEAIANVAPYVLGWSDRTGTSFGGSLESSDDRYG